MLKGSPGEQELGDLGSAGCAFKMPSEDQGDGARRGGALAWQVQGSCLSPQHCLLEPPYMKERRGSRRLLSLTRIGGRQSIVGRGLVLQGLI